MEPQPCYIDCSYFDSEPESPPPQVEDYEDWFAWPSTWYENPADDPNYLYGLIVWVEHCFKFGWLSMGLDK